MPSFRREARPASHDSTMLLEDLFLSPSSHSYDTAEKKKSRWGRKEKVETENVSISPSYATNATEKTKNRWGKKEKVETGNVSISPSCHTNATEKTKNRWGKKEKVETEREIRDWSSLRVDSREEEEAKTGRRKGKGLRQQSVGPQAKVVFHHFSTDAAEDVLKVEGESAAPSLNTEYDVMIKVEASTVTTNDCILRRGFDFSLLDPVCLPATPGSDLVGYIVQCGSQVEGFKSGDRVAALVKSGANARYISVPASSLVAVPRSVTSEEAACMVSIYATAFKAIKMVCDDGADFSLKDKKVVVVGGCDPVGQALIHLCKKAKASVIYASAPTNRRGIVARSLGVKPLPADATEWPDEVKGKMDLVFDGESNDISGSKSALNGQGKLLIYGMSAMLRDEEMGVLGAPMSAHLARMGNNMRWSTQTLDIWESFQNDPKSYKENLTDLFRLLKWQKLKPQILMRVSLSEVGIAQTSLESTQFKGLVVCLPWKRTDITCSKKVQASYRVGKKKDATMLAKKSSK